MNSTDRILELNVKIKSLEREINPLLDSIQQEINAIDDIETLNDIYQNLLSPYVRFCIVDRISDLKSQEYERMNQNATGYSL